MAAQIDTAPEIRTFRIADLELAAYNPRTISEEALRGLRESLGDLGLLDIPVVNVKRSPARVVSGHQRIRSLVQDGFTHVDCVVVRFDDAAEIAANLTMNNPAIRGRYDVPAALALVDGALSKLPEPSYMGMEALREELHREAARLSAGDTTASDATPTAEPKAASRSGSVYHLGEHRLLCGSFEQLPKVLGKKKAAACITDPPYNVAYESAAGETVQNDDLSDDAWAALLKSMVDVVMGSTIGHSYVFMSSKEIPALEHTWRQGGGELRWLFWVKDRFTLSRGDYHHQHEPVLWGCGPGGAAELGRTRTNVLLFPKPVTNALHPCQKPVELIRALMEDCTAPGDLVIDLFAGSGTTLSVAQELGRICYASEQIPKHCDTIRKRWAEQVEGQGCDWRKATPGKRL